MDFVHTRDKELQKYPSDLPVFVFLRRCREENIEIFEKILFFFGEIDLDDKMDRQTISWCTDKQDLSYLRQAFRTICPRGRLLVENVGYDMIEIRLTWSHDDDIDPVVFNKIIFPDFSVVPKRDLLF